ncbi:rhodanese-like domain-containing protein [Rouxiella badensis]|jgi:rhodanese-related sulfurtransferase|uniref:rhodanese-like domain-containing protein n=1 Tax=Rouxiella badensis TaxID=1646377 RepID=UPI00037D893B|nr:rhodanese-like domain-containing protein [Rouxiella badensis]MCC3703085.1 rhodanese [Rouxiella badensis]MCC3721174.1 rhodanese [Rouxiella badensis]MCC3730931.1 rhodanese [Rouxiella badensis]MCC3734604.1 rhodanese [Rouxiella badensis]MCC3742411.1 rhodanese [Rouxiella badensis]
MQPMSKVLAFPPPQPQVSEHYLYSKLSFYTDAWDVAEDLRHQIPDVVVLDARSEQHYQAGHIPGAVSFPHRLINEETVANLARDKVYVTYCDGIGCNGSTQGAYKLAKLGFRVKELIGGLDFWIRDGHPLAKGTEAGVYPANVEVQDCGCE